VGALEEGGLQFFATLVLSGPVLGFTQWLVLRWYIHPLGEWVSASALGWLLGITVEVMLNDVLSPLAQQLWYRFGLEESFWLRLVNEPVSLTFFGAFQWVFLRRRLNQAYWWILASVLGGAVKGAVSSTVGVAAGVAASQAASVAIRGVVASAMSYGSGWAGYGVVTGVVLVQLLQNRRNRLSL